MVNSYGYGSPDFKDAYNKFQAEGRHIGGTTDVRQKEFHELRNTAKQQGQTLSNGGDLHFKATVKPVCGITVTDADGELVFAGGTTRNKAKFSVQTNVVNGAVVELQTIDQVGINMVDFGNVNYNVNGSEVSTRVIRPTTGRYLKCLHNQTRMNQALPLVITLYTLS
ncbi:hypothetical protein [Sutcliffiella sp. BMC8]|uniref:hypothetical protein n=1 Tax=Sutcliffiella sp. BMC8 TaxID=3073243 RepID=UPI0030D2342B